MTSAKFVSIPTSRKNQLIHIPLSSVTARHRKFLYKLYKAAAKKDSAGVKRILQKSTSPELRSLAEVSQNLLKKTYPNTSRKFLTQLTPFKKLLRDLACCQTSDRQKRQILLQTHRQVGGLPFIIPLLAPLVGQLLATGISAAL